MDDLARLAALYGVATTYQPAEDVTVRVPDATVAAVLRHLGADTGTPGSLRAHLAGAEYEAAYRLLPRVLVWWAGAKPPAELGVLPPGTLLRLEPEQGGPPGAEEAAATDGAAGSAGTDGAAEVWPEGAGEPPLGVHRVHAEAPDGRSATATLIVAPDRAPAAPERAHGVLVQLYSLLSERSWGMGDLGDLAELARWAGRVHGAGFIQVNPLHAAVPGTPTDPSPYRPSSRRFPDPVHLRIEDVPEYGDCPDRAALAELADKGGRLRREVLEKGALIDRDAVWALKRSALELLYAVPRSPEREAAYGNFREEQGAELDRHAAWCAAHAGEDAGAGADFHRWLVWLTDTQLTAAQRAAKEAGMAVGIVHDLAVGVHPEGSDASDAPGAAATATAPDVSAVSAVPDAPDLSDAAHAPAPPPFAKGVSVGAPPDAFNARGQDWGLPPWRPDLLAATGYEPFRALLRGVFRYAGALRIDHAMGLFRLWWIPEGTPPAEGAYVAYDGEAMLALLVLEAHRAGALVIGEDLGTVQPGVRQALARRGVLGTSVLWFERDWAGDGEPLEPARWRADCLATATTHDLPPTAAKLAGSHVELRDRLGLLTRPLEQERAEDAADTARWLDVLEDLGLDPKGEEAAVRALYGFLLRTPARLVGVWLPDAVGDRRPQNLPGTWDQYPNWRLPLADAEGRPLTLEALTASPRANALLSAVRGGAGTRTAPPGARAV
ncbi:4-alpha-glucanotransferase [Streptomyces avidinii]